MVVSCVKIFSSASTALHACIIPLGVVFIVQCVGISTNYWVVELDGLYFSGLWKRCLCFQKDYLSDIKVKPCSCKGWIWAVRTLEITGLVFVFITGVLVFIQLFLTQRIGIKTCGILSMFSAGTCILVGVIVYFCHIASLGLALSIRFSFGLCTAAGILSFICGILLVIDRKIALGRQQASRQYTSQGMQIPRT